MRKLAMILSVVSISTSAMAENKNLLGVNLDFAAPIVSDKLNYTDSVPFGTILYDYAGRKFVGLDPTGSWVTLGTSTTSTRSFVRVRSANSFGSATNNKIRRFASVVEVGLGTDITYTDDSVNGATFEIESDGIYSITYHDNFTSNAPLAITKNSGELTTTVQSLIAPEDRLAFGWTESGGATATISWTGPLTQGAIIRPHTGGIAAAVNDRAGFTIVKISD